MRWRPPSLRRAVWALPGVLLLALWLPAANQGGFRVDTGLYAAVALHAYRDGSLFPLMTGDIPYFNKPPLAFWIHGLFLHLLGPQLWAARLPALLSSMLGVYALMACARRLSGPRVALVAGIVLALTLEWFRYAHAISLDLWVSAWMLGATWCVLRTLAGDETGAPAGTNLSLRHAGSRQPAWWFAAAGALVGLALLTKPLIALLWIPIIGIWLGWIGRARLCAWLGLSTLVALAVASPWHIAMWARFGPAFTQRYFGSQTLDRATGDAFGAEPWWWYLSLLAQTYWPWALGALAGAVALWRGKALGRDPGRRAHRLCAWWTLAWLAGLSIFAGKSGRYALPLYPMLAWLCALWLVHGAPRPVALARRAAMRWSGPVLVVASVAFWALGVRVLGPQPAHWDALSSFVSAQRAQGRDVWAQPDFIWAGANIYLATGSWPRFIGPSGAPAAGDIIIARDGSQPPPPGGHPLWRAGPMYAEQATPSP